MPQSANVRQVNGEEDWWALLDSNQRPFRYERNALTN